MPRSVSSSEVSLFIDRLRRGPSLTFVLADSRLREHDPILGIVDLPLRDILAHSSEVTRLFSLQDGVGFGKANISVLFKGVKLDLPQNLRGWDTGTVAVTSDIKVEPVPGVDFDFKEKKLLLSTLEAKQKLPGSVATTQADGTITWDVDQHIRLPTCELPFRPLAFQRMGLTTLSLSQTTSTAVRSSSTTEEEPRSAPLARRRKLSLPSVS